VSWFRLSDNLPQSDNFVCHGLDSDNLPQSDNFVCHDLDSDNLPQSDSFVCHGLDSLITYPNQIILCAMV
jgi:hypothetical protein